MSELHAKVAQVQAALHAAGIDVIVPQIDKATPTALAAAEYLGCAVGAIVKSLVFMADRSPALVLTSGAHSVDTGLLAGRIGVAAITRATPGEVWAAAGIAASLFPISYSDLLRVADATEVEVG